MDRLACVFFFIILFAASGLAARGGTQGWKAVAISYEDPKHEGVLAADYRIVRQKQGCELTIRLTNRSERALKHYWFEFKFKEGHGHENSMDDHLPGDSMEMTYRSCSAPVIRISEVE